MSEGSNRSSSVASISITRSTSDSSPASPIAASLSPPPHAAMRSAMTTTAKPRMSVRRIMRARLPAGAMMLCMTAILGPGYRVGHWTDEDAQPGCPVVLPPRGNVTSCDVRGSGPGSRELILLDTKRRLTEVHGIVLTGGSAFGLAAADGAMRWLAEHDIGYETSFGLVPIVPAAVVFDLGEGRADIRPGQDEGRAACEAATEGFETGRVGAGTGATVGKWAGRDDSSPGGLGAAELSEEGLTVRAIAVVNSVGDVIGDDGAVIAGTRAAEPAFEKPSTPPEEPPMNTVLVVATVSAT